jgi:hypothetical protein
LSQINAGCVAPGSLDQRRNCEPDDPWAPPRR